MDFCFNLPIDYDAKNQFEFEKIVPKRQTPINFNIHELSLRKAALLRHNNKYCLQSSQPCSFDTVAILWLTHKTQIYPNLENLFIDFA